MNNKDNKTPGFEDQIRNKMDELASSVDCFDKISKRAFPDNSSSSFDSEFTVSSVENITGKKKISRFMPAAALAAAAAVCLVALPRSERFMDFYSSLGDSKNETFRELISELNEETTANTYTYFDCSLDEYIRYDRLITPLYSCPFENSDKDDINVRIYVRLHENTPTNQIYAVEYEGEYEDNNIIAVADSHAKFTEEELENFSSSGRYSVSNHLSGNTVTDNSGYFTVSGYTSMAAGFSCNCIYKHDGMIYDLSNEFLYCSTMDEDAPSPYFYDLFSTTNLTSGDSTTSGNFDISLFDEIWDNSVYYNGSSAMPDEGSSVFTYMELHVTPESTAVGNTAVKFVYPFISATEDYRYSDMSGLSIDLELAGNNRLGSSGNIIPPLDPSLRDTFRIYAPASAEKLDISTSDGRIEYGFTTEKFSSDTTYISAYGANGNYYKYRQKHLQEQEAQKIAEEVSANMKAAEEEAANRIAAEEEAANMKAAEEEAAARDAVYNAEKAKELAEESQLNAETELLRREITELEIAIETKKKQLSSTSDQTDIDQLKAEIEMDMARLSLCQTQLQELLQKSLEETTQ